MEIRPDEGVHTGRIYRVTGYEPMLIKYQHIHTLLSFRQLFHAQKAARAAHGNALSERWGGDRFMSTTTTLPPELLMPLAVVI